MAHGRRRAITLIAGSTLLTAASGGAVAALSRQRRRGDYRAGAQRVLSAAEGDKRDGDADADADHVRRHFFGARYSAPPAPPPTTSAPASSSVVLVRAGQFHLR